MVSWKILHKILSVSAVCSSVILSGVIVFKSLRFENDLFKDSPSKESQTSAKWHFVLTGNDHLDDIFEGAASLSKESDFVIEKQPLDKAFDYAKFCNANGIILYCNDEQYKFDDITNIFGDSIPVVCIGTNTVDSPLSFISTNRIELAEKFSSFITRNSNYKKILFLSKSSQKNFSTNLAGLIKKDCGPSYVFDSLFVDDDSNHDIDVRIREKIYYSKPDCIISLDSELTLVVTRIIISMNMVGAVGIAGYNTSDILETYCDKKIISCLVYNDYKKAGSDAVTQLVSFHNYGFANAYITTYLSSRMIK